jgi:hypothetical protein
MRKIKLVVVAALLSTTLTALAAYKNTIAIKNLTASDLSFVPDAFSIKKIKASEKYWEAFTSWRNPFVMTFSKVGHAELGRAVVQVDSKGCIVTCVSCTGWSAEKTDCFMDKKTVFVTFR